MAVVKPSFSNLMPRGQVTPSKRRRTRSRFRKRSRGRKRSRRMATSKIYKRLPIGGFKPHQVVRLRYSDVVFLDPASGGSGTAGNVWWANNIYDPDYTGTGHQPLYRDTWATIYKNYIVLGAKIKCVFEPVRNVAVINAADVVSDTTGYTVGCLITDGASDTPTSTNTLIEIGNQRRCRFKIIPAMATNRYTTVTQTYSPKSLYGLKDTRDHLSELGAAVGGGPSTGAYFQVFASNADNSSNPVSIPTRVIIDYLVMFYDIIDNVSAS